MNISIQTVMWSVREKHGTLVMISSPASLWGAVQADHKQISLFYVILAGRGGTGHAQGCTALGICAACSLDLNMVHKLEILI
jgi:hypothetical protein